jgi:hypothetical protein
MEEEKYNNSGEKDSNGKKKITVGEMEAMSKLLSIQADGVKIK